MAYDEKAANLEMAKAVEEPPTPPPPPQPAPPPGLLLGWCTTLDVGLRVVLFASTLTALLVMVTSKQTELARINGFPLPFPVEAKFNHSPAFM